MGEEAGRPETTTVHSVDAPEDGGFLTEQQTSLGTLRSVRALDHFDGGALSQIRFAKRRRGDPRQVVALVGLGRGYL